MTIPTLKSVIELQRVADQFADTDPLRFATLAALGHACTELADIETRILKSLESGRDMARELERRVLQSLPFDVHGEVDEVRMHSVFAIDVEGLFAARQTQIKAIQELCIALQLNPRQLAWLPVVSR